MSDFELLKSLQKELISTLQERKGCKGYCLPRSCTKAKIHRLRLQINEVMFRIESKVNGCYKPDKEGWE